MNNANVALVTGGGTGLGRAIAIALAHRGLHIMLNGRRPEPLADVAALIQRQGGSATSCPGDIADALVRERLIECAHTQAGPLTIVVHCAGQLAPGSLLVQNATDIQTTIATHLTAAIDLTRLALPQLIAMRGHIVLIGSTMSYVPMPYAALYAAAKAGLRGFAEALRYEAEPLGIHVLAVYPPALDTAMLEGMPARAGLPWLRLASPEAAAAKIVRAIDADRAEIIWGPTEQLLIGLQRLAPRFVHRLLASQRRRFGRALLPNASYR